VLWDPNKNPKEHLKKHEHHKPQMILLKGLLPRKNLTTPYTEIFNSDSIIFEIWERDTKAAKNQNTAEKDSYSIIIPKAINIKNNPNIQQSIPLSVIFNGSF
jgi:hypothetical protein